MARNALVAGLGVLTMTAGCAQSITLGRETPGAVTIGGYAEAVKAHIRTKWSYPCIPNANTSACEYKNATVVIQFGIHKDGSLGYVRLVKPSGYPTYDQHAIDTVKSAAPFPPIPDSFSRTGVPIDATMNYVVKEGEMNRLK